MYHSFTLMLAILLSHHLLRYISQIAKYIIILYMFIVIICMAAGIYDIWDGTSIIVR